MKRIISCIVLFALALSLAACGGSPKAAEPVDLNGLYESFGQYLPEMFLPEGDMRVNYLGIEEGDCAQIITAVSADGLAADEVWLIQAKDEAALSRLKELAENRMAIKADETVDYNPEQYKIVQKGVILTSGNYLALLVSPQVDEMQKAFNAAMQ